MTYQECKEETMALIRYALSTASYDSISITKAENIITQSNLLDMNIWHKIRNGSLELSVSDSTKLTLIIEFRRGCEKILNRFLPKDCCSNLMKDGNYALTNYVIGACVHFPYVFYALVDETIVELPIFPKPTSGDDLF